MNQAALIRYFDRISAAPGAVPGLRQFILDLAVRGKLVAQNPKDRRTIVIVIADGDARGPHAALQTRFAVTSVKAPSPLLTVFPTAPSRRE